MLPLLMLSLLPPTLQGTVTREAAARAADTFVRVRACVRVRKLPSPCVFFPSAADALEQTRILSNTLQLQGLSRLFGNLADRDVQFLR